MSGHQTLGWIGLGKMGWPMWQRIAAGYADSVVYDALPATMARAAAHGAAAAQSAAGLAARASVVFSSVPDDAALRAVAIGPDGLFAAATPGLIFVDTSTVSPAASAEIAQAASAKGVQYLRVTVSGTTVTAAQGKLTVMVSGPKACFDMMLPHLQAIAGAVHYLGEGEQARVLKLVVNSMIANTATMLAEALTLGRRGGLDWAQMLDVIGASAVGSPMVNYKIPPLKARNFAPAFTIRQMAKDLHLILDAAENLDVPMPATAQTAQAYRAMLGQGAGEQDYIAVVQRAEIDAGLSGAFVGKDNDA